MTTRSWLVPTRRDPLNRLCADWAGFIATIEWILILWNSITLPTDAPPAPTAQVLCVAAAVVLLTFVGFRGILSRRPRRRLGSLVLLATNLTIVLAVCYAGVHEYLYYHRDC